MQAAIDRVLRTFTLPHPTAIVETLTDHRPDAARDEPTAFATRLLENYKTHLAERSVTRD